MLCPKHMVVIVLVLAHFHFIIYKEMQALGGGAGGVTRMWAGLSSQERNKVGFGGSCPKSSREAPGYGIDPDFSLLDFRMEKDPGQAGRSWFVSSPNAIWRTPRRLKSVLSATQGLANAVMWCGVQLWIQTALGSNPSSAPFQPREL